MRLIDCIGWHPSGKHDSEMAGDEGASEDPLLTQLQFYRDEIRFESQMLSDRVDALISSQSFLVLTMRP
jgi:hypothetical protein